MANGEQVQGIDPSVMQQVAQEGNPSTADRIYDLIRSGDSGNVQQPNQMAQ